MDDRELYNQILEILDEGDEEKLVDFVIQNLDKFSEDFKTEIVGALFEDTVDKLYSILQFKKEVYENIVELEKRGIIK